MRLTTNLRYRLEYAGMRVLCAIIKTLPISLTVRAGRTLGRLSSGFLPGRIRLAHQNLQYAFGDSLGYEERCRIIDSLLGLFGEAFIESLIVTQQDIARNITIERFEYVTDALQHNRGVIILGAHFGLWELASYLLGSSLRNGATVYKPLKNPYVNSYLIRHRERLAHLDLIPSKNALRPVLSRLKQGHAVVVIFDQNAGREGLPATFFGKTASTYAAPAVFALKTGCAVVPGYTVRDTGFRRHRIIFEKPFTLIETGNREQDILANTQRYNAFLEELVRRYPDQWFGWFHQRWKIPRRFPAVPPPERSGSTS